MKLLRGIEVTNTSNRDEVILSYQPYVKYVVYLMSSHFPSHVDKEDILSAGMIGLLDALDRYDPSKGFKFSTFAFPRIRGAVLDFARKEVSCSYVSNEPDVGGPELDEQMIDDELRKELCNEFQYLPSKEWAILWHHYVENVEFKDVAIRMGVTQSRVSQIHKRAVKRLQSALKGRAA